MPTMNYQVAELACCRQELANSSPAALLPDNASSGSAFQVLVDIDEPVFARLEDFSTSNQTAPSIVLLAAVRATHYRLTGSDDMTLGVSLICASNQIRAQAEPAFTPQKILQIAIDSTDTFKSSIVRVQAAVAAASLDQHVFTQELSQLGDDASNTSAHVLAQLAFNLQTPVGPIEEDPSKPGIAGTHFEAECSFFKASEKLTLKLICGPGLVDHATIQNFVNVFQEILRRGLDQPQIPLLVLPLNDGLEALRSLGLLDTVRTPYPRDATIVDVFRQQASAYPGALAVKDATSQITYAELDHRSDKLAVWLHQKHLASESLIGVLARRSCEAVVAFLGIIKANLAYLPLDVDAPIARIESIISTVPGKTLILLGADVQRPQLLESVDMVRIGEARTRDTTWMTAKSLPALFSTSLAYVIFTSGSTGKPKGVMIEHRGVIRLVKNCNYVESLPQNPRIAHLSNLAFDASIWEICGALLNGGTLICIDQSTLLNMSELSSLFKQEQVQTVTLSPAMLKLILASAADILRSLDVLFTAGDRLDPPDAQVVRSLLPNRAYNLYGPSENTVGGTMFQLTDSERFPNGTPIGRSIDNSGAYVMDVQQRLVSAGVVGELVLTGDGLARGYTDPSLDIDRFVQVEIDNGQSVRAYRTGDRARWRPSDGLLEFLGRIDNQIKIRGHRIELAEIEHAILGDSRIEDAAVVLRHTTDGEPEIVGFVTTRENQQSLLKDNDHPRLDIGAQLRSRLQVLLPVYMLPAQIIALEQMPLNANTKVDRKELGRRAQQALQTVRLPRTSPRDQIEKVLCEELAHLVGFVVGVEANFFELGGHSIMATKLASSATRRIGTQVSVKDILGHPVIEELAVSLRHRACPCEMITAVPYRGPARQSFAQGRLWFLDQLSLEGSWYLVPLAVRLHGKLNKEAFEKALSALVQRHETLRTTFADQDGVGVQIVHAQSMTTLREFDFIDSHSSDAYLQTLKEEQTKPFDLQSEPGFRVSLLLLDEDDCILSIVMHHIISDGWSIDVLRHELDQFYCAALQSEDPLANIDALPIQYRDFSLWQRQQSQIEEHEKQLSYWTKKLADSTPAELPTDYPRPALLSGQAEVVDFSIDADLYQTLQTFSKSRRTTQFTVLLAAFRIAHYRLTGSEDAMIGVPVANRNRPELENLIGFFVNTQCIRITIGDMDTFESLVHQTRAATIEAQDNQDVPFERLVSALLPGTRDISKTPLVQLHLVLHSQVGIDTIKLDGLTGEPLTKLATTRADVEFHIFESSASMKCQVLFAKDLFKSTTIENMVGIFREVLLRGLQQPLVTVADMPLTGTLDLLNIKGLMDISKTSYPRESSIIDIFREQVYLCGNTIAVKDSEYQLDYTELDQQSDQVASWLSQKHLPAERLVGVLAPRSCEAIVAFLGILKAGLAYMPLDIKAPAARLQTILSSVPGDKLVLVGADVAAPDFGLPDMQLVPIAETLSNKDTISRIDLNMRPSATSLAYVIFTSGSTGKPKGVMIEHRGVVRLVKSSLYLHALPPSPRVSHTANLAFDTSVWEIYTALLNGGTIVCVDSSTVLDINAMETLFLQEQIHAASIPPALLKLCLDNAPAMLSTLHVLLSGGDRLDPKDALRAQALVKGCMYNAYGPTENTVDSVQHRISLEDLMTNGTPIGRAINNSGALVMDTRQVVVPIGVVGELVVTGDGLARGYTDKSLDSNRFITVAVNGQLTRAYRTGDRARWRPDGLIEFLGRMDNQIKIRGHRIELTEVEQTILSDTVVTDAAVVIRSADGENEMVGFVTTKVDDEAPQDEILDQLDSWEEHFDSGVYAHVEGIDEQSIGHDFYSWTSMLDNRQIPKAEMQEWLNDTLRALLDGKPAGHVLEIGSGTGMMLFNLGEGLRSYVGFEPAKSAAAFINRHIRSSPSLAPIAKVHVGSASDLHRVRDLDPELVVINSVAQYFPSPDYMLQVVESLLKLPRVQRIFFGDIRSYAINDLFIAARSLHALGQNATVADVRQKMQEFEDREEEFLVDPAFFTDLPRQFPGRIQHVEILPKIMEATNELSAFRYAAVIHVREVNIPAPSIQTIAPYAWIDFEATQMDRQTLLHLLQSSADTTTIAVENVPNGKVAAERHLVQSLRSSEDDSHRVAWANSTRDRAENSSALSAWDLVQVGKQAGFSVEVSCARQRSYQGALDAVFHRSSPATPSGRVMFQFPTEAPYKSAEALTTLPLRRLQLRQAEARIRTRLQQLLPTYMIPSHIIVIPEMPLNASNKVDRKELSRRAKRTPRVQLASATHTGPCSEVEIVLCEELSDVLGFQAGVMDNFFELGGHSLMASKLASRISRRLDIHVSVKDIFDFSTMAALADQVAKRRAESSGGSEGIWTPQSQDFTPYALIDAKDPTAFVDDIIAPQIRKFHNDAVVDVYPATHTQQTYLNEASTRRPRAPAFFYVDFAADAKIERLVWACEAIVQHFDIFRTVFVFSSGCFYQVVLSSLQVPFTQRWVDGDLSEATAAVADADESQHLNLGQSLLQIHLLRQPHSANRLVFSMSHALYDGLSLECMLRSLHILYRGGDLPKPAKFVDYVSAMARERQAGYEHWRSLLRQSEMTRISPTQSPQSSGNGIWYVEKHMGINVAPRLKDGITQATIFTTACAQVLAQRFGLRDIVFGRDVSGRQSMFVDSEVIVGPCTNTIPVRLQVDKHTSALHLLRDVQKQYLDCLPFEKVGLDEIREHCTDWPESVSQYGCCTAYHNFDAYPESYIDGEKLKICDFRPDSWVNRSPIYGVEMEAYPSSDQRNLHLALQISRGICDKETAAAIINDLCNQVTRLNSILAKEGVHLP